MRLFLVTRAPVEPITAPGGTRLTYHDQHPTTYNSLFGNVRFARHFFTAPGQEGRGPLDAELSLPARCYADLLREWAVYGATDESSGESQTVLERILGVSLSLQAIETSVAGAAGDVTVFLYVASRAEPEANRWRYLRGASRWPGGTDGATGACDTLRVARQGAKTHQQEGSRRDEPLYHGSRSAYPPGRGGGLGTRG